MRCFIAIDLPDDVKTELIRIQDILAQHFEGNLVSPENLHITLKFLGNIDEDTFEKTHTILSSISHDIFNVNLQEISVFTEKDIKTAWVGISGIPLHQALNTALKPLYEPDNRFIGHITLARIKKIKNKKRFLGLIAATQVKHKECKVAEYCVKESITYAQGPVYHTKSVYRLL
jgi:2'-5' RNA ligase